MLTAITPPGAMAWPGQFLAESLVNHVTGRGGTLLTGHRVTGVRTNGKGEVIGVEFATATGKGAVRARRGVVFASGGFAHDPDKLQAHLRGPVFGSGSTPTGTGALLDIAVELGARLGNLPNGFFYQVALEELVTNGGKVFNPFTHCFLPYGTTRRLPRSQPSGPGAAACRCRDGQPPG